MAWMTQTRGMRSSVWIYQSDIRPRLSRQLFDLSRPRLKRRKRAAGLATRYRKTDHVRISAGLFGNRGRWTQFAARCSKRLITERGSENAARRKAATVQTSRSRTVRRLGSIRVARYAKHWSYILRKTIAHREIENSQCARSTRLIIFILARLESRPGFVARRRSLWTIARRVSL